MKELIAKVAIIKYTDAKQLGMLTPSLHCPVDTRLEHTTFSLSRVHIYKGFKRGTFIIFTP